MYLTTLFFFFLCEHQLSTYIHIKDIYLYIVVPVNCGPGKYISFLPSFETVFVLQFCVSVTCSHAKDISLKNFFVYYKLCDKNLRLFSLRIKGHADFQL